MTDLTAESSAGNQRARAEARRGSVPDLQIADGAIDVHAHYLPASYRAALKRAGLDHPDNVGRLPDWDVKAQLATTDSVGMRGRCLIDDSTGEVVGVAVTESMDVRVMRNTPPAGPISTECCGAVRRTRRSPHSPR